MSVKNRLYTIRFSEEQFKELSESAKFLDQKVSEYIRNKVFAKNVLQTQYNLPEIKRIVPKYVQKKNKESKKDQVINELKSIFERGLELIKVSDEMKKEIKNNRLKTPLKPKKYTPNLKPPPI